MAIKDPRIDAYISTSADFAKPILKHLRKLVHKACPEAEETIKWGMPFFDYLGILCHMASFKQHCAFGFWRASLMKDPDRIFEKLGDTAMGQFGQIKSLRNLPADKILLEYIKEAAKLNADGIRVPAKARASDKKKLIVPDYFKKALGKSKKAVKTFESFSYSHKKDYLDWITEAKTEVTRQTRLKTAILWMSQGKGRNWKYERK